MPIISDRGLDAALDAKCEEVQILISRLKYLTAHQSLIIIKHCINVSKIMHILRTNKCHENDKLETFDTIIRAGLDTILNVELSNSSVESGKSSGQGRRPWGTNGCLIGNIRLSGFCYEHSCTSGTNPPIACKYI